MERTRGSGDATDTTAVFGDAKGRGEAEAAGEARQRRRWLERRGSCDGGWRVERRGRCDGGWRGEAEAEATTG